MVTATKLTNSVLKFTVIGTQNVQVQPQDITPSFIASMVVTPNGNNPSANGNNIFVWLNDGGTTVPWGQQPVASAAVSSSASVVNGSFGAHQYIVAYSVGPAVTVGGMVTYPNICATSAIPSNWNVNECVPQSSSVTPATVQAGLVTANYAFPAGFNPVVAGSWIGIYAGNVQPYGNTNLMAYGSITQNTSSGAAPIVGPNIAPNQTYTLVLFNSGYSATQSSLVLTSVAAVCVFTTTASLADM